MTHIFIYVKIWVIKENKVLYPYPNFRIFPFTNNHFQKAMAVVWHSIEPFAIILEANMI